MKKILLFAALTFSICFTFAQSECGFKYGATPEDSTRCLTEITQFNLQFKAANYPEAYNSWQYIVNNCPCSWSGVFANAPKMLESMIKKETDSIRRERLVDSLLWVYDAYPRYHPKYYTEGKGIAFKAYYSLKYHGNKDLQKAYDWFVTSIEMEKENTQPIIWSYYFTTATILADTNMIIEAYERANDYIDAAIVSAYEKYEADIPEFDVILQEFNSAKIDKIEYDKKYKKLEQDTTRQLALIDNYNKTLAKIESSFIPFAPCNVLERVYSKKVAENRDNIPLLQKIIITMNKSKCQESPIFREALEIVYRSQPNAKTAEMMGSLYITQLKDYDKAIEYFKEAITLYTTNERKAQPYYLIASIYLMKGNYSEARDNARSALRMNPKYGQAYILIGDCYKASAGRCNNNDDQTVIPGAAYWAAADKYNAAASVDPSVASIAASRRASLPGIPFEEIFKRGYNKGQSYHVGCWINENTTIR